MVFAKLQIGCQWGFILKEVEEWYVPSRRFLDRQAVSSNMCHHNVVCRTTGSPPNSHTAAPTKCL